MELSFIANTYSTLLKIKPLWYWWFEEPLTAFVPQKVLYSGKMFLGLFKYSNKQIILF